MQVYGKQPGKPVFKSVRPGQGQVEEKNVTQQLLREQLEGKSATTGALQMLEDLIKQAKDQDRT